MSQITPNPRLRPCPDCEHLCSVAAAACPQCGRPLTSERNPSKAMDDSLFGHIMMQASMKVGMCLTLLGLVKVVEGAKGQMVITDEVLAVDALLFLVSNLIAYYALKQTSVKRKEQFGRVGDVLFTVALVLLVAVCALLAFQLV